MDESSGRRLLATGHSCWASPGIFVPALSQVCPCGQGGGDSYSSPIAGEIWRSAYDVQQRHDNLVLSVAHARANRAYGGGTLGWMRLRRFGGGVWRGSHIDEEGDPAVVSRPDLLAHTATLPVTTDKGVDGPPSPTLPPPGLDEQKPWRSSATAATCSRMLPIAAGKRVKQCTRGNVLPKLEQR
jgi:hypothetical protein